MKQVNLTVTLLRLAIVGGNLASANIIPHFLGGKWGEYLVCPENEYALGYCSSGEHYDCWVDGDGRPRLDVTILGCGPFPGTEPNMTAATTDEENDVEDINGWICGKYGELLKCPVGQVMIGACGSGGNPNCADYCASSSYSAIKCATPPRPVSEIKWGEPLGYGIYESCPNGEVQCGACQSGKNKDCQGGAWRIGCCSTNVTANVLGFWVPINQIVVVPSSFSYTYGTQKSETETKTTTWSASITDTVEMGLKVEGLESFTDTISETISKELAQSHSKYWSMSELGTWTYSFDTSYVGHAVWQWVYKIEDYMGNQVQTWTANLAITEYAGVRPKCLPGYDATNGTSYQTCYTNGYLPGVEPSSRGLRGLQQ